MIMAIGVLQGLLGLAAAVCSLAIIVSAFRKDLVQGLLCLFLPFYVLYWAFTRFEHPQRRPIMWIWLGAPALAFALAMISVFSVMGSSGVNH